MTAADWYRVPLDYGIALGDNVGVLKILSVGYSKIVYEKKIYNESIDDIKENINSLGCFFTRSKSGKCIVWEKIENDLIKLIQYNNNKLL